MLRPHSPLYNIATDAVAPTTGGGNALQTRILGKVSQTNPEVAGVAKAWTPKVEAPAAATPDTAAAEAEAAKAAEALKAAEAAKAAETAKPGDTPPAEDEAAKAAAAAAASDDDDDAADEIADTDAADVQLKKLVKAQKKALKRIDKLTQRNAELETKLQSSTPVEKEEPVTQDALPQVSTIEQLDATAKQIDDYLQFLAENAGKGTTVKDGAGKDVTLSPEDVVQEILWWTDVKAKQVPAKRAFIETRAKAQTEAATAFKPWQDKAAFTTARAEVEAKMQKQKALLPDYELALNERALARLVLSGAYDLVPKSKAAPAVPGASSAPVKAAPPVNPPSSGGPPIKPAGTGPDLETLKQNMLKHPGNRDHVNAYVKATMAGNRAA